MDPDGFLVLAGLLAAHVCGDTLFYSRFVSGWKRADRAAHRMLATSIHCLFHAVLVFGFLWPVPLETRLWACLYVFTVHFLIDASRVILERAVYRPGDNVILSKTDVFRYVAGTTRGSVDAFFRRNLKPWLRMNLLDQAAHLASLLLFAFVIHPRLAAGLP